jgi:Holliday junction resolvase
MSKHDDIIVLIEELMEKIGYQCVRHGNIDGSAPDLVCACGSPLNLIEVESTSSLERSHTKKQIKLMMKFSEEKGAESLVVVYDEKSDDICGIPLTEDAPNLMDELGLPSCMLPNKENY